MIYHFKNEINIGFGYFANLLQISNKIIFSILSYLIQNLQEICKILKPSKYPKNLKPKSRPKPLGFLGAFVWLTVLLFIYDFS